MEIGKMFGEEKKILGWIPRSFGVFLMALFQDDRGSWTEEPNLPVTFASDFHPTVRKMCPVMLAVKENYLVQLLFSLHTVLDRLQNIAEQETLHDKHKISRVPRTDLRIKD